MGSRNTGRSVPLKHYFEHAGCGVWVDCRGCQLCRRFEIPEIIARLERRGVRAAEVGVQDLARYIRAPCPRCGGEKFDTRPAFPSGIRK